jgi:hypothetical protein
MGHLIISSGFGIAKSDKKHDNGSSMICLMDSLTSDDVWSVR